jgi:hypothetical protein
VLEQRRTIIQRFALIWPRGRFRDNCCTYASRLQIRSGAAPCRRQSQSCASVQPWATQLLTANYRTSDKRSPFGYHGPAMGLFLAGVSMERACERPWVAFRDCRAQGMATRLPASQSSRPRITLGCAEDLSNCGGPNLPVLGWCLTRAAIFS